MKKLRYILPVAIVAAFFALPASAALTPAQKTSLLEFARKFISDGSAAYMLHYGWDAMYNTVAGKLCHASESYVGSKDKRRRIIVMAPKEGYDSLDAYNEDAKTGGYFKEGDYFVLDCTCFIEFIYKYVFGIRFNTSRMHMVHQWQTMTYSAMANTEILTSGSRKATRLFDIPISKSFDEKVSVYEALKDDLSKLEVGDIIIGRNEETGLGHIMFASENECLIHASSNPVLAEDGRIQSCFVAEVPIECVNSKYYDRLFVLRIADGVLDDDFAGYTVPFDFSKLTFEKSIFDNTAPYIAGVSIVEHKYAPDTKYIRVYARDEYGTRKLRYFAYEPDVPLTSSAFGETGVCGIAAVPHGAPMPDVNTDFEIKISNTQIVCVKYGDYDIYVRDAAGNISKPWHITVGKTDTVYPSYTVTYLCCENFADGKTYKDGDIVTVTDSVPQKENKRFIGWRLHRLNHEENEDDGKIFCGGDKIEINENISLMATYEEEKNV